MEDSGHHLQEEGRVPRQARTKGGVRAGARDAGASQVSGPRNASNGGSAFERKDHKLK